MEAASPCSEATLALTHCAEVVGSVAVATTARLAARGDSSTNTSLLPLEVVETSTKFGFVVAVVAAVFVTCPVAMRDTVATDCGKQRRLAVPPDGMPEAENGNTSTGSGEPEGAATTK